MTPGRMGVAAALGIAALLAVGRAEAQPIASPPTAPVAGAPAATLEPDALSVLRDMSATLSAAKSLSFAALATYESPAMNGQPLYYMLRSQVLLERPDKLAIITPGDGPPTELYYDGKQVIAYNPELNAAAVADAPPTIDAMLQELNARSATYYPFADIVAADPYKAITDGLTSAFVVGRSHAYGGIETVMVALATPTVQAELWVGAADRLPRMIRAVYVNDPNRDRLQVEFSDWRLNAPIRSDSFGSARAMKAPRMPFARPDTKPTSK